MSSSVHASLYYLSNTWKILWRVPFKHISNWYNDIKKFCGKIPIILLGNKVDLIDKNILDESKVLKLIQKREFLGHFITSALTGEGVVDAFQAIIRELYNKYKKLSLENQKNE